MLSSSISVHLQAREGESLAALLPFLKPGATVTVGRLGATVVGVETHLVPARSAPTNQIAPIAQQIRVHGAAGSKEALKEHLAWRIATVRETSGDLKKTSYGIAFGQIEMALLAGWVTTSEAVALHADLDTASESTAQDAFNLDQHVRLTMAARRYEYLRRQSGADALLLIAVAGLPGGLLPVGGEMLDTLIDAQLAGVSQNGVAINE